MTSTRRTFFTFLTSGLAATAGLAWLGCGGDDADPAAGSGGTGGSGAAGGGSTSSGGGAGGSGTSAGQGGGASGACLTQGTTSSISANHGHELLVSKEDVSAGLDKTYDIEGGGNHSHTVTVSAAQFAELASDQEVTVSSTTGAGHTHQVTIQCA